MRRFARWLFSTVAVVALRGVRCGGEVKAGLMRDSNAGGDPSPHQYSSTRCTLRTYSMSCWSNYAVSGEVEPCWPRAGRSLRRQHTFTFRRGVTFSDGAPARAAKANFDAVMANAGRRGGWA